MYKSFSLVRIFFTPGASRACRRFDLPSYDFFCLLINALASIAIYTGIG